MYEGEYKLVGSELSMFTRKLEAQLRFQKIPFTWRFKTMAESADIEKRGGTRFIPLLETPDGWMVHDTIALGPMLNDRFYQAPVVPETLAQRGLCFILEDFYNHWLPRHALHSRWCYPENVPHAGNGFGANMVLGKSIDESLSEDELAKVEGVGDLLKDSFGLFACGVQGAGIDQKDAVQSDFKLMMSQLSKHFEHHDFLLGGRPCLADFALVGTCKAHFLLDPEPKSWLGEHEAMLNAYVDRVWNGDESEMFWLEDDKIPETLAPIFEHIINNYQVFAKASIECAARGEKEFKLDLGYGEFTARAMKRLEKARLHVQDELNRVDADNTALAETGLLAFYQQETLLK